MKSTLRFLLAAIAGLVCLLAQKTTTTTPTTGTGTTTPSNTTPVTAPVNTPVPGIQTTTPAVAAPRQIYVYGRIVTDDSSPLPADINIQTVCSAQNRTVAHVTPDGDFSFRWADPTGSVFEDASNNARYSGSGGSGTSGSSGMAGAGGGNGRAIDPLANCDLRAAISGYTSASVGLYGRDGQEMFDVGTITLHRISGDEGHVVSMLALRAPKDAKKYFDKGTSLATANKTTEAAASFRKAVESYPQYADAWMGLGQTEMKLGQRADAETDFHKAMDLDDKLVGPWQELGFMASDRTKWDEAAKYLDRAVRLDPMAAKAWYFDAVANYNLGRYDLAERSVRAEMKLDKNPQAQYLLGVILIARKDPKAGAEALRTFIAAAPQAENVASAKVKLSRAEGQLGQ